SGRACHIDNLSDIRLRTRADLYFAGYFDAFTSQIHAIQSVDLSLNTNQTIRGNWCLAIHQHGQTGIVNRLIGIDHLTHELDCRRRHRQRADIHHAAGTDHEPLRTGKEDITADLAAGIQTVERAVDLDLVVDQ